MSDFINGFWNYYVMVLVAAGILFCLILLMANYQRTSQRNQVQGHVWDGDLEEFSNPLPKWWLYLFWITIIFAVGYLICFPGFGNFKGVLNWSSGGQYTEEVNEAKAEYGPYFAKYAKMDIIAVSKDPEAQQMGKRLFLTYCSQCHGSDAGGARGFPNLTNPIKNWGGNPDNIVETITNGRMAVMTPFDGTLEDNQIKEVAQYIRAVSGRSQDTHTESGKEIFLANCAVCHGENAEGNPLLGAPALGNKDRTWLWGSSLAAIEHQIKEGRINRMPGFGDFLGEDKVHILAAYVWHVSHDKQ